MLDFLSYGSVLQVILRSFQWIFCLVSCIIWCISEQILLVHGKITLVLALMPLVSATPEHTPFPDIPFQEFSKFIKQNFDSHVSLTTVLILLFTMTSNPELINLHARQQHPRHGEIPQIFSGWILAMARALEGRLGKHADGLLKSGDEVSTDKEKTKMIGGKLHALMGILRLDPYTDGTQECKPLGIISESAIEPAYMVCPQTMECQNASCNQRALHLGTRDRDVPLATLIKGTKICDNASILSGKCRKCETIYYADHESFTNAQGHRRKLYLNDAKYLKVGQSIWVDRTFSASVLNGVYHFHASSQAYTLFWNESYWLNQNTKSRKVSRRQVWHTFVQDTIRRVAKSYGHGQNLELPDNLPIDKVTKHAFSILGEQGIIRSAQNHFCPECTHEYKDSADVIIDDDPAALLSIDENRVVPQLQAGATVQAQDIEEEEQEQEEDGEMARDEDDGTDGSMGTDQSPMEVDEASASSPSPTPSEEIKVPVKMVVLDGIVMGPTVSIQLQFLCKW